MRAPRRPAGRPGGEGACYQVGHEGEPEPVPRITGRGISDRDGAADLVASWLTARER